MSAFRSQGAEVVRDGVRYRTWAPGHEEVEAVIYDRDGADLRVMSLGKEDGGYFAGVDRKGCAGDRYKYRFGSGEWPDPASRFNPDGVHGAAEVIDPSTYDWQDANWKAPPLSELIIYELHLGTFTPKGTFRAAIDRLEHVASLGATAIELMPVADFPGARNWGYDGVALYAPARSYGAPDDLRALVEAAHAHGLAVILDVVYNHLGPDGNYLGTYSRDYFNRRHKTPWGEGFNFELRPVRDFFVENAAYWRREFHFDGFRLDATHAIVDDSAQHVLGEVAEVVHSLGGFVIAEDERNEIELLEPAARGGLGLDAKWSDDFHHVVRVPLTGACDGYYRFYRGTVDELAATLAHGWLLEGKRRVAQTWDKLSAANSFPPQAFVFCISNHDQIGNHAFGRRLNQLVSPAAYRAASALLCLAPYTPLLFMGQEWAAATPFQFFTDHEPELGRKITAGRREEFRDFAEFRAASARANIPDPQAEETFRRSKLNWAEREEPTHAEVLALYRECLRLRREVPVLRERAREDFCVLEPSRSSVRILFGGATDAPCLLAANLSAGELPALPNERKWELIFSSNEERFGGDGMANEPEVRLWRGL